MQASPELNMNMINMQSSLWNLALFFSQTKTVCCWLIKLWPEKLCLSLFLADKRRCFPSKVKMKKQKMFSLKFIIKFACRAQRRKKWLKRIIQWNSCNHVSIAVRSIGDIVSVWNEMKTWWQIVTIKLIYSVQRFFRLRKNELQSFNLNLIKLTNNLEFEIEHEEQLKKISEFQTWPVK